MRHHDPIHPPQHFHLTWFISFVFIALMGFISPVTADMHVGETLYYEEIRGDVVTANIWALSPTVSVRSGQSVIHIQGNNAIEYAQFSVTNNNTYYWKEYRLDQDTAFEMTRKDNQIKATGIIDGELFSRTFPIDPEQYWVQAVGISLVPFILSEAQQLAFQLFSIKDKQFIEMQVIKKGSAVYTAPDGTKMPAEEVWFTPTGWRSKFWKAVILFSTETGYLLTYDGLSAGMGSAPLRISLRRTSVSFSPGPPPPAF